MQAEFETAAVVLAAGGIDVVDRLDREQRGQALFGRAGAEVRIGLAAEIAPGPRESRTFPLSWKLHAAREQGCRERREGEAPAHQAGPQAG